MAKSRTEGKGGQNQKQSAAEWVSLAISVAIVGALVALLTYDQLASGSREPQLVVTARLEELRPEKDAFYLPVTVQNRGARAARDVRVRVTLPPAAAAGSGATAGAGGGQNASAADGAELLFDFVAGGATSQGVVVLRQDPRQAGLSAVVSSYVEP